MHCVIEKIERHKSILVPVLNCLCRLLKSRQHGTLTTGKVLARIAVLAYFGKDVLHQPKLIRHKGISLDKLALARITFQVKNGIIEREQIFQHLIIFLILQAKHLFCCIGLGKDTLFDDFINA